MQVRNVSPYNNSVYQPVFQSLFRLSHYTDCFGRYRYTQNSTGIRDDLSYDELAQLVKKRFSKFDKINVMPMNGSDGTESYLIANSILNTFGEKAAKEKVFPILVTDVDPAIIEQYGQKGLVALKYEDIDAFGDNFNKYFEKIDKWLLPQEIWYAKDSSAFRLTPEFKKLFKFEVMDFQKRMLQANDTGNSVFIIRNCLAESFGIAESDIIISKLGKIMHPDSLFVIGGYDRKRMSGMIDSLNNAGFKEVGKNIFSLKG